MPIPKQVARWNKAGLNRVVRRIAPWMPGLGVVVHRGRRSGRAYRTPVEVFQARDGFVIALTYGADTDWLRNIQAAGGGELRTRGLVFQVSEPRVYHDEERAGIRLAERRMLGLLDVADFVHLKAVLRQSSWSWPAS
jgi:deazaflavin-dependent oxidoreductase (nitroreductase family)